jgi:predicted phosphodiesterase
MVALTLQNSSHKILVVGPIYDKLDKLERVEKLSSFYDLVILNGNICYPFDGAEERIKYLSNYLSGKIIYNAGNYDLQLMQQTTSEKIKEWINNKPNVILIGFKNQTSIIITSGGLSPQMTKKDLYNNLETSFISNIDNKPWHVLYGGGYGYVISNNPLSLAAPHFYNYSAQIGNSYGPENQVYAQEIDQYGLKDTILL